MDHFLPPDQNELNERIRLSEERLQAPYYCLPDVFSPKTYDWPGDKEGRALLAFTCHYRMTGRKIPAMDALVAALPEQTNEHHYFGALAGTEIDEQQLSGHNWYLCGLLSYYELFGDEAVLQYAKDTVEHLYLPLLGRFESYPLDREKQAGGISGNITTVIGQWNLSSDVGCAFMSIDGLARYYALTKDARVLALLKEMQEKFDGIDKMAIEAQTHCCLTAARGFLTLYAAANDPAFLSSARKIADLYERAGMTYTYENYNWWHKGDTWTEPCAVVDSLILFGELYKITKDEHFRTLAARVWHNGFASCQTSGGGAGSNTTVGATLDTLAVRSFENPFCCSMRLASGLLWAKENADLLSASVGPVSKNEAGVYMAGDLVLANVTVDPAYEALIDRSNEVTADGIRLMPLIKLYRLPEPAARSLREKIVF